MISISFYRNEEDMIFGFETEGHAEYAKPGKDIVCAAVSILIENTVNSIEELLKVKVELTDNPKTGYIDMRVSDYQRSDVQLLFNSLELGLKEIEKQFEKNVRLTNRRCKP